VAVVLGQVARQVGGEAARSFEGVGGGLVQKWLQDPTSFQFDSFQHPVQIRIRIIAAIIAAGVSQFLNE